MHPSRRFSGRSSQRPCQGASPSRLCPCYVSHSASVYGEVFFPVSVSKAAVFGRGCLRRFACTSNVNMCAVASLYLYCLKLGFSWCPHILLQLTFTYWMQCMKLHKVTIRYASNQKSNCQKSNNAQNEEWHTSSPCKALPLNDPP